MCNDKNLYRDWLGEFDDRIHEDDLAGPAAALIGLMVVAITLGAIVSIICWWLVA